MWILFVFFNSHRRLPLYLKFQPFHKFRCCSGFFRRWISVTFGESVDAISVPYNKVLHLRQETSIKLSGLLPTARVKPGSNSFFNAKTYLFCLFCVNNNFVIHPLMDFASQYSKKKKKSNAIDDAKNKISKIRKCFNFRRSIMMDPFCMKIEKLVEAQVPITLSILIPFRIL